jgi:2,4-diketo-3-deoxy-L-fuconate hydrolase
MRICRFDNQRVGVVEGDWIYDVTDVVRERGAYRYPLPIHDVMVADLEALRPAFEAAKATASRVRLTDVRLLSPVANPGKIVAAPVNYSAHLAEAAEDQAIHFDRQMKQIKEIGLFLKAGSSLIGASDPVVLRHTDRRNDHEIELVAVIGRTASKVSRHDALSYVAAYAIGLDMTLRGVEERSLRKSIDSFSVVGPWMVTADELSDPANLQLTLSVNGETRQQASTADLVIDLEGLIEMASSFYTLHPGDLLFTGTPAGVGPVTAGDTITAEISQIGSMTVQVLAG